MLDNNLNYVSIHKFVQLQNVTKIYLLTFSTLLHHTGDIFKFNCGKMYLKLKVDHNLVPFEVHISYLVYDQLFF